MRSFHRVLFIIPILILIDLYVLKGLAGLLKDRKPSVRKPILWGFMAFSMLIIVGIFWFYLSYEQAPDQPERFERLMCYLGFWLVQFGVKFFYIFFELAHDIRYLIMRFRPKKKFR